ncbi:hypothetical protein HY065_00850, partial [Candidatus Berkelbacteria bacterium]|nr:hypothetical protein [Candidatus Berkelbacteria bacterium]
MPTTIKHVEELRLDAEKIEIFPGGSHCSIAMHVKDGSDTFIKIIGGKKCKMTKIEAEQIAINIETYQKLLVNLGVPVAECLKMRILHDQEDDDYRIVHIARFMGNNAEYWFEQDCFDGEVVDRLIKLLHIVLANILSGTEIVVGYDPKPQNCARFKSHTRFVVVDTMPPRFRK